MVCSALVKQESFDLRRPAHFFLSDLLSQLIKKYLSYWFGLRVLVTEVIYLITVLTPREPRCFPENRKKSSFLYLPLDKTARVHTMFSIVLTSLVSHGRNTGHCRVKQRQCNHHHCVQRSWTCWVPGGPVVLWGLKGTRLFPSLHRLRAAGLGLNLGFSMGIFFF